MLTIARRSPLVLALACAAIAGGAALLAQSAATAWQYPETRVVDHVDTYHGTAVADPYRWLEDDTSPETKAWVEAQNKVTFAHLEQIPFRAALTTRLRELLDYPRYTAPTRRGGRFFYTLNQGRQNHSVVYVQAGLEGKPEALLDPNTFSADGKTRLGAFSPSRNGAFAVYGISVGGSDWQEYRIIDTATRKTLDDRLEWIKVSGVAWHGDGFYYSRYPAPGKGQELSFRNENHKVYYHKLGTPQSADELVYEDPANPQRFHGVRTTEDERFALLTISERGKGKKGNAVFYRDSTTSSRPRSG